MTPRDSADHRRCRAEVSTNGGAPPAAVDRRTTKASVDGLADAAANIASAKTALDVGGALCSIRRGFRSRLGKQASPVS